MRSSIRPVVLLVLLAFLLVPGLLFAKTAPVRHSARTSVSSPASDIFSAFTSVWNLLTSYVKSGGQMDPNGAPVPPPPPMTSADAGDNGGQMDPNGTPK
jgi:hypothetical protein